VEGKTSIVLANFDNTYFFGSVPYNADVIVNNVEIGKTPLFFATPEEIKGTVTFEKTGYVTKELDFETG